MKDHLKESFCVGFIWALIGVAGIALLSGAIICVVLGLNKGCLSYLLLGSFLFCVLGGLIASVDDVQTRRT